MNRIFDWSRQCPLDFARRFPPIVGGGRGVVMNGAENQKIDASLIAFEVVEEARITSAAGSSGTSSRKGTRRD